MAETEPAEEATPNFRTVKVDVETEVAKLAAKDGVTSVAQLAQSTVMSKRDYYRATVFAHYHGYDQGYAAGVSMLGRPIRRWLLTALATGAVFGAVIALTVYHLIPR